MQKDDIVLGLIAIGILIVIVSGMDLSSSRELFSIVGDPSIKYTIDLGKISNENYVYEPMMFGSDEFLIYPVSYDFDKCGRGRYRAGEPKKECWTDAVYFQDNVLNFTYGEIQPINDFFEASFTTYADVREPDDKNKEYWIDQDITTFTFTMYNSDFLESRINQQDTLLELNSDSKLSIEVRNDLANNLPGGLVITTTHYLENQIPKSEKTNMVFKKGTHNYEIDLDTSKLGRMNIKIRPYVTIMGKEFHDNRVDEMTFNIVPFIEEGYFSIDCTNTKCKKGFNCNYVSYKGDDYNICIKSVKGELSDFNEWNLENLDLRLIVILLLIFAFLVFLANRGGQNG